VIASATPHAIIAVIVAVSILLMLVRPRNIAEVYWVGGGALLLVAFRLIPLRTAGQAAAKGLDVYLFLIGMMLLSELAREYGVFDWLSSAAVHAADHSCPRLFFMIYALGTMVTVFMSNDATAVVLTPAVLAVVRKARLDPLPYLFVCAIIANAASFVLPISNPANLVVFHGQMPPLARWLAWFGIPSLLSIIVTYFVMRWIFRDKIRGEVDRTIEQVPLTHQGKLVLAGLIVTAAVLLTASGFGIDLGLPTCLTALAVTAAVSALSKKNPMPLFKEISWSTLALVAGLFIMVAAAESIGAMNYTRAWLEQAQQLVPAAAALITGFGVGIANNIVNNLPLGLIAGSTLQSVHAQNLIAAAVMIGVDLGPNLAITGSLATILWLIALRKEGLDVSFWSFLKVGAVVMPLGLLAALFGAIATHFVFGLP
jgi:arsenical pump membrane protein